MVSWRTHRSDLWRASETDPSPDEQSAHARGRLTLRGEEHGCLDRKTSVGVRGVVRALVVVRRRDFGEKGKEEGRVESWRPA